MSRWIFLVLGFGIGLAGGLYYAWLVSPVEYVDTAPDSLRADFRADYLGLIASAYASSGDLVRTRTRLALFPDLEPSNELAALAQQRLAEGFAETEASALSLLASALSSGPVRTPLPPPPAYRCRLLHQTRLVQVPLAGQPLRREQHLG